MVLCASIATAAAAPIFSDTTPGLTSFTVPADGSYDILALGAGGGTGFEGGLGGMGGESGGGGFSFVNGATGGSGAFGAGNGGFGGGGGSGLFSLGGDGGTSFDAGNNPLVTLAANAGDGAVTITPLAMPAPEPASLTLLGAGLLGLLAFRSYPRRR